jgi:hypothetical protein
MRLERLRLLVMPLGGERRAVTEEGRGSPKVERIGDGEGRCRGIPELMGMDRAAERGFGPVADLAA